MQPTTRWPPSPAASACREDQARGILATDTYAADVRAAEQMFQRSGISAIPAVIINKKHLISGGQPVEVFERALREVAAGA